MINKPFDQIDKETIDGLITNAVSESKTLDYKEELPSNKDEHKRDFLADISAFANASGGDLIYGIKEQRDSQGPTGIPETAEGLENINIDKEIQRLESMIQEGIKPRIKPIGIKAIEGFNKGPVLVVRIPKSWNSPHMVTFGNLSRFYSRNSRGKYQLDVTELRAAFIASESLKERMERFRDERISKIIADETPIVIDNAPKSILHVLPLLSFDPANRIDITQLAQERVGPNLPKPPEGHYCGWYWTTTFNFEGYLTYQSLWKTGFQDEKSSFIPRKYLQIFRNGAIEFVKNVSPATDMKDLMQLSGLKVPNNRFILSNELEGELIEDLETCFRIIQALEIDSPVFVIITLFGIYDYYLVYDEITTYRITKEDQIEYRSKTHLVGPIMKDLIPLPETIIDNPVSHIDNHKNIATLFRPLFNIIWQTAGEKNSFNYDEEGIWRGATNFPKLKK
ncbi:MAG: ATP-binding protein [Acidobacteriota bacterium]